MQKPDHVQGVPATVRWMISQAWRDMKSIYFANTPFWRWLKSGALVFLGFCVWAGTAVLLSVEPDWDVLYLPMAYGFLLILWGPLTHLLIVPLVLRVRRRSQDSRVLAIARNAGKINLTIFFAIVVGLAVLQPGLMVLEFGGGDGPGGGVEVEGEIQCVTDDPETVTCTVENAAGFDHAVVIADGEVIERADEPAYELTFDRAEVDGSRFLVELRDADGDRLRTASRSL